MSEFVQPSLRIDQSFYPVEALRRGTWRTTEAALSENARAALEFCQAWLNGQPEFVVNTSGSTGTPKSITLTREQMTASAQATGQAVGLQRGHHALVCLPTQYIAGRMMLVRGLVLGLTMTVVEPASQPLRNLSADTRFDFTALVPLQLQSILADATADLALLNQMQAILIGGGPVDAPLAERLQVISAPVYHTYGMTETVSHVALRRLNGPAASEAFVPLPGVQLGLDERGCLTISGPMTRGEQLVTNDLVELRADGSFRWLGRWDNVINSGGVKVQVEKVEAIVGQLLSTVADGQVAGRAFFVGPLQDERLGQAVTLVLEGEPLPVNLLAILHSALEGQISRYEMPRRLCYLAQLQRTPTGKIDRPANLQQLRNSSITVF
jgi:O-succinylbenzoic acid--CoA ligase